MNTYLIQVDHSPKKVEFGTRVVTRYPGVILNPSLILQNYAQQTSDDRYFFSAAASLLYDEFRQNAEALALEEFIKTHFSLGHLRSQIASLLRQSVPNGTLSVTGYIEPIMLTQKQLERLKEFLESSNKRVMRALGKIS